MLPQLLEWNAGWLIQTVVLHRFFFYFFYLQSPVANHDGPPLFKNFPLRVLADLNLCFQLKDKFFSTFCCSAGKKSHRRYSTKVPVRVQARSSLCCDAYMLFRARQGYLYLLITAECLYHLFQLAAGDSEKSQEIYFQNPVTLLRQATEFARSDSQDNIINILLSLFFFFLAASLHPNVISLAKQHPHLWPAYLSAATLNLACASTDLQWSKAKFPHIQP